MPAHRLLARRLSALALFSIVCPALAESVLEEVVVTADFRERPLAEIPASATVIDSRTIADAATAHFEELTQLIPNLNYAGGSNRPRYFQIRGTGERSQYEGAPNPSVGFIIDDIDFSALGGVALTWDTAQIEVLRGPQGTRYGANALAGLINVRSIAPGDEWTGRVRAQAGGDDARSLSAAFGGPLGELLGESVNFRLSAHQYEADGFRDNPFLGRDDTNGREESEFRARLRWEPGADWRVDLTALYVDVDNGYDAFAINNSYTTLSDRPGRDAQRSRAGALRVARKFGATAELTAITTAAVSDIDFSFDADWGNPVAWAPFVYDFTSQRERLRETVSQELRLVSGPQGRLFDDTTDWLFGVYALKLREDLDSRDQGILVDPTFGDFTQDTRLQSDYSATNSAVFGQLDTAINDTTGVTLGLRVERRDADYVDSAGSRLDPAETMLGGHLGLTRDFGEHGSGYVTLARGYKAGGFNLGQVPDGRREYDAEFMWNLEFGWRNRWLDDRLQLNAALFVARRDEQQIDTSFQINPNDPSSFVFFLDNAASGDDYGLEVETSFQTTETLRAYASVGLLHTEVDLATDELALDGRAQAHAPEYTFAVGVEWAHPAGPFARVDITGKDAFFFSNSHDERSEAYELVNLRAGYRRDNWSLSVWARNVFDTEYAVRGFFFGNEPPDFPETAYLRLGDRRQAGVSIEWGF